MVKVFKKASFKTLILAQVKIMIYNFNKKIALYNKLDGVVLYNDNKF